MNKTALITGGCGFVGSHIAARLRKEQWRVVLFDSQRSESATLNRQWLADQKCDFRTGDVRQSADLRPVIKEVIPSVIFHMAGNVAMTISMTDPRRDFESNLLGTINLLEIARDMDIDCPIVFASTNKIYGSLPGVSLKEEATRYSAPAFPEGISESAPLDFQTPYGCSKGAADQYGLDYARSFGLNTVSLRCSRIYGERQPANSEAWIGWFCRKALEQAKDPNVGQKDWKPNPFTISGNGKQVRDPVFIDDAVDCFIAAASRISQARGQAINIGGGMANTMSLLELLDRLEKELNVKLHYENGPERPNDQKFFAADISKAKRLLGWEPRIGREEGIRRALAWEKREARF